MSLFSLHVYLSVQCITILMKINFFYLSMIVTFLPPYIYGILINISSLYVDIFYE